MLDIEIGYPDDPGDDRPLRTWLARLPREAVSKLVIAGKTEGPATLNDFSRHVAQAATDRAIEEAGTGFLDRSFRLFSTGCEGVATPLSVMIAQLATPEPSPARVGLAVGIARSGPADPAERCGPAHIDSAARTVAAAMQDGGLRPEQVSLVLIKSPIHPPGLNPPGNLSRHAGSTGSSRGAAAIGAGIALGDLDRSKLSADPVGRDPVFATRTMAFSGIETDRLEAIVLGEREGGDPRWGIAGIRMTDFADSESIGRLKAQAGEQPHIVFFKAGIAADGRLRGRRTTVLTSDLTADKQLRAAASGLIAAHFSAAPSFISGGAEHQAPPGGCLCAAIYRRE